MAFSNILGPIGPVLNNVTSLFKKDGTEMTDEEAVEAIEKASKFADSKSADEAELKDAGYGKDAGDNFFAQIGSAGLGGWAGWYAGSRLGGDKLFPKLAGAVVGSVVMHKIGPELVTDIQRGWQSVDQQKAEGKSEGKLADRFAAIWENVKVKGQSVTPDPDIDVDV